MGIRGYSQWERGQMRLLSGQASYIQAPKGSGEGPITGHRPGLTCRSRCLLTDYTSLSPTVRGHEKQKVGGRQQTHPQGPEYSEHRTFTMLSGALHTLSRRSSTGVPQGFLKHTVADNSVGH